MRYWVFVCMLAMGSLAIVRHSSAEPVRATVEREGLQLQIEIADENKPEALLRQGEHARIKIKILSAASGEPVRFQRPGAWLDFTGSEANEKAVCAERIGRYLRSTLGARPLVDFNSYFVLMLNDDNTIAIIDPLTRFSGKTSLYGMIKLAGQGFDWLKTEDDRRVFVSIPASGKVAVVDADVLRVVTHIETQPQPGRLAISPDQRMLWVGHDGRNGAASGVSIIDTVTARVLGFVELPKGHHEFALSEDSSLALVTSRDTGSVTLLDGESFKILRKINDFGVPIAAVYSSAARAFFVVDAKRGQVIVLNRDGTPRGQAIQLKAGLGPARVTSDGRWLLVLNPIQHVLDVVDTASQNLRHRLGIPGRPFQIEFSSKYAYVRSLDSENVSMVQLASLGTDSPIVKAVAAGALPPAMTPNLPIASSITQSRDETAMFFVSPSDNAAYFYMEGMNAAGGGLQAYGHRIRAAMTVNRGLREAEPGVYSTLTKLPVAGKMQLAVALGYPPLFHCTPLTVESSPDAEKTIALQAEWVDSEAENNAAMIKINLFNEKNRSPISGLKDVKFAVFDAGGGGKLYFDAQESSPGVYGANLAGIGSGTYYIHVGVASWKVQPGDLLYRSLVIPSTIAAPVIMPSSSSISSSRQVVLDH